MSQDGQERPSQDDMYDLEDAVIGSRTHTRAWFLPAAHGLLLLFGLVVCGIGGPSAHASFFLGAHDYVDGGPGLFETSDGFVVETPEVSPAVCLDRTLSLDLPPVLPCVGQWINPEPGPRRDYRRLRLFSVNWCSAEL